jgi:hypothetical protein
MGTVRVTVPPTVTQVVIESQAFKVDSDGTVTIPTHFAPILMNVGPGYKLGGGTIQVSPETAEAIKATAAQLSSVQAANETDSAQVMPIDSLQAQIDQQTVQAHDPEISEDQRAEASREVERLAKEFEARQRATPKARPTT